MKSRDGKSQREEKSRILEERRWEKRKSQKKEDADARKGRKVAKHCVFPMIWGSGGSKSRLAKAAIAEPSGQMRDEKCTPLWREAHFEVKVYKKHTMLGPLLKVEMSKKCTLFWCEAHFLVQMYKTHQVRNTFGSWGVEKVHAIVVWSTFLVKSEQNVRVFVAFPKTMAGDGRHETFEEDLQRCIFRGRRNTRDIFIRAVRRSGRWFPERGCILELEIFSFGKMILRDRCSTWYDLASLFRGRRSTLDRWSGKIATRIGTRPSALQSTFHVWRKSRRIASFLMLSTWKIEEISQNGFVFDVVKLKSWGSLAELLRFWRCPVQTLRKSRRMASRFMLSTLKNEDVSQNCYVFDVVNFEEWRSLAE